jgi:isocitrate/isopropylmalate dehydrogenase
MIDQLREAEASRVMFEAIKTVLKAGIVRTRDLGGNNTTVEVGDAVADAIMKVR